MSELLRALILGIVQGLTEFLPVSSSGHLELAEALLHTDEVAEVGMLMTVVLHFGTALATMWVFRGDIASIVSGIFGGERDDLLFAGKIASSMLPAAAVGLFFEEELDALFTGEDVVLVVGFMLAITGLLLLLADRARETDREVTWRDSVIIGLSQAIAIMPGISRSGATISTSVLLGVDRTKAARFSFLMVVPLIFGAIAKDLLDGDAYAELDAWPAYLIGFLASFFTGIAACTWMISIVRESKLRYFAYYCFAVAVIAVGVTYLG